jgi:histidinol-phosphatase (PHP family)
VSAPTDEVGPAAGEAAGRPPALPGDYHVHTAWSDGVGTVEDVACRAAQLGLPEIAIAEHFTPSPGPDEDWWLRPELLAAYVEDVHAVAARHDDVTVLLGVEAEYVDGQEAELEHYLSAWPFEVVVLGVHEVDGFTFDDPALRRDARWDDPDALLSAYYRTVRRACAWGRFDILAHVDYIGLWGHRPGPAVLPEIEAALDALAASGAAIELNTDRFSDPAGVMYPSVAILRAARARGVPLTIDSDAHEAEHVGRAWDEAIAHAGEAGYLESLRLSDRELVPLPG